ncbi:MAG: beta-eliminating lyase-related protein [Gemmatimonadota bacterium]|nr:beta-eliminating lyase-related protein [Gemmatimonadota bacterium]
MPTAKPRRALASDNWAGVHPEIIAAIAAANVGHAPSYGEDPYTKSVVAKLRDALGADDVFLVFTGTAANVIGLESIARPHNAVICASTAHIHTSECGAAEKHIGCKLLVVPAPNGKITPEGIAEHLHHLGNEHHAQPSAVSISQATEYGTVYSPDEVRVIANFAHDHDMRLHMDGARLANAAASLGRPLREMGRDLGVDVLTFGGTKNGALAAEAVVYFDGSLAKDFEYRRMQSMQLASKMRFIAAQFDALFTDDLWLRSATHANRMAALLGEQLARIPGITLTQKVEANEVFAIFPREHVARLQDELWFQVWNEGTTEVRLVASFDTTTDDVTTFVQKVRECLAH